MEYESVYDVPCGLISCRVGNVQAHIVRISPRGARLRIAQEFDASQPAQFCFFRADDGMNRVRLNCAYAPQDAYIFDIETDDPMYARCVRAALSLYAKYVTCRMDGDARGTETLLTRAPEEGDTADGIADQYDRWYRDFAPSALNFCGKQIYVMLDSPALWNAFLTEGDFWDRYARLRRIPRRALPDRKMDGIIIGSEYCANLFPGGDTFDVLMRRARDAGVRFSIAAAEAASVDILLRAKEYQAQTEVLINDWGMLDPMRGANALIPALGTRLNRRRKDPRLKWRSGYDAYADLIPQNAANDPAFRKMLGECGVLRYEYESCGSANAPVGTSNSLHLPLYHTNASRLCTLRAMCEFGDRGRQIAGVCGIYCEDNACLYPERYRMLGRGNAIVAFDADFASEAARGCYDRIVFNF